MHEKRDESRIVVPDENANPGDTDKLVFNHPSEE